MAHSPADPRLYADPEEAPTVFEQPLTERMRMFLRIEFLNRQARFHAEDPTEFGARAAVASLLEILAITGRGDVRADVLKELDRHSDMLMHFQRTPGIDRSRLERLLTDVEALRQGLSSAGKQFMATLRESEFLNAIRQRSAIPGGTCGFDLPDYTYWLSQPQTERIAQLSEWLSQLRPLCEAIDEVLWLTREASEPAECVASQGLYQHTLKRNEHVNLVRVLLDPGTGLYPEISAGSHRFTVRFAEWQSVNERSRQSTGDVEFRLSLC
jgi:cell division protein ZapD